MTFRHSVICYDPSIDWAAVCAALFQAEQPYLCVAEKLDTNGHVHMQGRTKLSQRDFDKLAKDLLKDHYKFKDPKARPIHHMRRETTAEGYQYMCKENPVQTRNILAKNMFTDAELTELWEKSELYVKELKEGLRNHLLNTVPVLDDPAQLHTELRLAALDYYVSQGKLTPPNFQKLVLNAMANIEPPCKKRKLYIVERI